MPFMFKDIARLLANPLRVKLLKFFLLQNESYLSPKASALGVGCSMPNAERELRALLSLGILLVRGKGARATYVVNPAHPLAAPLRVFLEESTLSQDRDLIAAFRTGRGISLVVVAGVLARESRGSVDFLIVTSRPKDPSVLRAVKRAERLMAIPLRYFIIEPKEYDERLEARDRILRDIFEFKHRVLIGRK
jgi:hypothetical protein